MSTPSIGAIGLGLLGTALVERLLLHGHTVRIHNRTQAKGDSLIAKGAVWSENPLAECDLVVICLYTTEVVREMIVQLGGVRPGTLIIDTTTGDPRQTRELAEWLESQGGRYLEAPIIGSSEQTRRGDALSTVAGKRSDFEQARGILQTLAPHTLFVGDWGSAAKMKLVNNLILGLNRAALAEGLAFAETLGLDPADTLAFLQLGNARSAVMETKGKKMVERDFSTQAKLSQHLKDVRLILAEAERAGLDLPLSLLHRQLLEKVEKEGRGEWDNSAILTAYLPPHLD